MTGAATRLDLPTFAYLSLPTHRSGKPKLISNYPTRWTTRYLRNRYQKVDPVIERAKCGGCPFLWGSDLGVTGSLMQQQQLFDEAAEFGIRYGFTIPIVERQGGVAALTFAADEPNPAFFRAAKRHGQALELMATCLHIHVRRKLSDNRAVDGVVLTPREYECLQWAARGKSAWDISCILGIKRRTAAFHLENARKKLGVRTITQAAVRLAASKPLPH